MSPNQSVLTELLFVDSSRFAHWMALDWNLLLC